MTRSAVVLCAILSFAFAVFPQSSTDTTTVTNAELEKFRQKRLAAEKEYRENYAKLGFPSPEELERQRVTDLEAQLKLAETLRAARLEEERMSLERQRTAAETAAAEAAFDPVIYPNFPAVGIYGGYGYGYYPRSGDFRDFGRKSFFRGHLFRTTPVGVIRVNSPQYPRFRHSRTGRRINRLQIPR